MIDIPSVANLKRLMGDATPELNSLQRIHRAVEDGTPPFDGCCHQCNRAPATHQLPIGFTYLVLRTMENDGGLEPTVTAAGIGVSAVVAPSQEYWEKSEFPLLMCDACRKTFDSQWEAARSARSIRTFFVLLLVLPMIAMLLLFAAFAPYITVGGVIFLFAMYLRNRGRKSFDPFVIAQLEKIPVVADALSHEDEYTIEVSEWRPWKASHALREH